MLSLFPELLFLSPLAAALLRVAAACVFFYAVNAQVNRIDTLATVRVPILGSGAWIVWASITFDAVIGLCLLTGTYTQGAALAGLLGIAIAMIGAPEYIARVPIARGTLALTFVILISLVLTGAGAFAFDLPL